MEMAEVKRGHATKISMVHCENVQFIHEFS